MFLSSFPYILPGFNEVETTVRTTDGKTIKLSEVKRKHRREKTKEKASKEAEQRRDTKTPESQQPTLVPKKPSRVTATGHKPSKYSHNGKYTLPFSPFFVAWKKNMYNF